MGCAICGGELRLLGQLGGIYWFRCQNCGHEQAVHPDEELSFELLSTVDYDEYQFDLEEV